MNDDGFEVLLATERGRALRFLSGVLELIAPRAFAPGQPMEMKVVSADAPQRTLVGKSAGSKRREDGAFDVRVRLHSLTREDRAWLEQAFTAR